MADSKDIVSREQMNSDKDIFPQQRLLAIELSKILTNKKYQELYKLRDIKTVFPNGFSVYKKELVIWYIKEKHYGICLNLESTELKFETKKETKNEIKTKPNEEEKENIAKNGALKDKEEKSSQNDQKVINTGKILFQNYFNFKNSLNSLFKSASKSRFNFVNPDRGNEISEIIPSQINDLLTQQFMRHSHLFQEEQNILSDYYFSLKQNSLDSDESWSSLISTIKKWNNVYENSDEDEFYKFNTY